MFTFQKHTLLKREKLQCSSSILYYYAIQVSKKRINPNIFLNVHTSYQNNLDNYYCNQINRSPILLLTFIMSFIKFCVMIFLLRYIYHDYKVLF